MIASATIRAAWPVLLVLLVVMPLVTPGSYYQFMLILVFIHAVVAIGLNILTGYSGLFSLGHAALMAMGAYTSALVSKGLATVPALAATGFHVWIGMIVGTVAAAAFGAVLAAPSLRLKGPYLAMVTVAFGWVVWKILLEWVEVTGGELGITAIPKANIGPLVLTTSYFYYFALAAVVLATLFQRNLIRSAYGRRLLAVRHSEIAAASVGINVYGVKVKVFVISAALAGVGGALFAHQQNFVNPDNFQFFSSVFFLLAVLFGGAGTLVGPVIGAAVLTLLPELLHGFDRIRLIVYGVFILATLYFQPNGVAGFLRLRVTTLPDRPREDGEAPTDAVEGLRLDRPAAPETEMLLEVRSLTKTFGGLTALRDVSLALASGKVHAVIGPNGAGKTTLINLLSGFYRPDAGEIRIDGRAADIRSMHAAAGLGIARTFQTIKLFGELTVVENVMVGFERHAAPRLWDSVARTARGRREESRRMREAEALIAFVGLGDYLTSPASALSYGHRRLLEIARALAVRPRILLLDEPAAGLVAEEIDALRRLIRSLCDAGIAIVLVEHRMELVTAISDEVTVIDYGEIIAHGEPGAIQRDRRVIEAYLGSASGNAQD